MIKWIKELHRIVQNYPSTLNRLSVLEHELRDRTSIHADISCHRNQPNVIIVCGSYKGRDYVQTYSVNVDTLEDMIGILREWEKKYGNVKTIDAPPVFKSAFKHEVFR